MLSQSLSLIVFRKELRETLRDKRVILGVIVSPLLVTPLLMGTFLFFVGKKTIDNREKTIEVGIFEEAAFPQLVDHLENQDAVSLKPYSTREDAENAVKERKAQVAVVVAEDAASAYQANASAPLEIIFNAANENSFNALSRLQETIRRFDREALAQRIEGAQLPEQFARPTRIERVNIATSTSAGSFALGLILPYIIVMSAAFGSIQTAFDICAGEKERGTMETLLVSPASRYQIVVGKLLTILVISLIASCCALTGILVPISLGVEHFKGMIGDMISFNFVSVFWMMLIVIPLALFTSSILLVISSFSRNQKEAQTYIFPFFSIVILPAMLSSILGAESQLYTAFIPILNISLTMKQIFGDVFDPLYFGIALGSSLIYALIAVRIAAAFFQREQILFRT